jgi:uncharacterized membrane protein YvbJ
MNCPACGRALASGAKKCVFCGDGTKFKRQEQLQIPKGTVSKRKSSFPWGTLILVLVLAAAVAACFLHPELNAKIRSLIPF